MTPEFRHIFIILGYILAAIFGAISVVFGLQFQRRIKSNYPEIYKNRKQYANIGNLGAGWFIDGPLLALFMRNQKKELPQDDVLLQARKLARLSGTLAFVFYFVASEMSHGIFSR